MIEELCALVEGKEWDEAWFLTIGLIMDIPELEVNIGRVDSQWTYHCEWIRSQYWKWTFEVILHWLNLGSSILIHSQVPLYSSCDVVTFPTFMGLGMFWSHSRTSCKNVPFSFSLIQSKHHRQKAVCVQKVLYHFQDAAEISLTWNAGFFDRLSSLITDESKLDFCIVSVTPLFGIPSMILNAWNLFFC